jgi:transcription initiation factor TFIIIB Brf1 subunit/transcription initiation factor TFIIB
VKPGKAVWGCQRCGSGELRMPGVSDAVIVGEAQDFGRMACTRCGLVAVAITFDDEEARKAFEAERAKDPSATWPPSGWPSLRPFDKPGPPDPSE